MRTFIVTITKAPYKITEIEELNGVIHEWKNTVAPIEFDVWSQKTASILFFGNDPEEINKMDKKEYLEKFFIFKKDSFLTATGFQKKYGLARAISKLAITHIAIKRELCEVFFNPDDEFSLEDIKMLAHLEFNVSKDLIDDNTVAELFTINEFTITEKSEGVYTVSRPQ